LGLIAVKCAWLFPAGWQVKVLFGAVTAFLSVEIVIGIRVETFAMPALRPEIVSKWMSGWAIFFPRNARTEAFENLSTVKAAQKLTLGGGVNRMGRLLSGV